MKPNLIFLLLLTLLITVQVNAQKAFNLALTSTQGDLAVTVLGHASVLFAWNNLTIYVDPYSKAHDFSGMEKADIILISHQDDDHFDSKAIGQLKTDSTLIIYTSTCKKTGIYSGRDTVMANGDSINLMGIGVKAVPAYNIVKSKHVKGVGNGYILTFGDIRIYIAGDTEVIPEMESIKNINIAFLGYSALNMNTEMFLDAISVIQPKLVIPYHYDNSDISSLVEAVSNIERVILLTQSPGTSASQINSADKIRFYPNPANKILYGNMFQQNSPVSIYNYSGRLITRFKVKDEGAIDVGNLSPGIYFFTVSSLGRTFSGRFSVDR
jgi:L-ascorbate metabolism protein UlaG (beta-lactamase superfamily)